MVKVRKLESVPGMIYWIVLRLCNFPYRVYRQLLQSCMWVGLENPTHESSCTTTHTDIMHKHSCMLQYMHVARFSHLNCMKSSTLGKVNIHKRYNITYAEQQRKPLPRINTSLQMFLMWIQSVTNQLCMFSFWEMGTWSFCSGHANECWNYLWSGGL